MALSDTQIKKAKPESKPYKMFDGGGLYVEVAPSGGKLWRLKYRFERKEKRLSFGKYPEVSLKMARDRAFEARQRLAEGIDPGVVRKAIKAVASGEDTFEFIARECLAHKAGKRTPEYAARVLIRLEQNVFPWLGARPIKEIRAPELLSVIRRIEARGAVETAHRILQSCGQVFRFAIASGKAESDLSSDLRGALTSRKAVHLASIKDPRKVGQLLRDIDGYSGYYVVKSALRLAPLVFVRPGELRAAQWSEIDLDKGEWRIPAERMKMKMQHIVPLSRQAVDILRELEPYTNKPLVGKPDAPRYVFPAPQSRTRNMSENGVLSALRRMGYSKEEMTGHGFRSMASTLLHELGWGHQVIERQLAHTEPNAVSAAYNFAEHLPERRRMMQAWADYLDGLKGESNIVPFYKAVG
jgi:integrase